MTVPKNILESFDIAGLQTRMTTADWYYDYSEHAELWNQGLREVNAIKKELQELCRLERGKETANFLWDAYVPEYSINKPDFLIKQNESKMNETNLAALEKKLLNLGFGDQLNDAMKKNIEEQKPEFNLQHEFQYGGRAMTVDLAFKAGSENEMYFFNRYQATLKDEPERSQTFYMDRGNGITTKEAFNLLEARAVNKDLINKEGEKYNAWVQLDFAAEKDKYNNHQLNRYHENYNYDLPRAVGELILKPMSEKEEKDLMASLYKGNVQSVTFLREGEEVKGFIEANPKDRTINIYDGHMKPLSKEQKQDFLDHQPSNKQQEQKQTVKAGGDDLEETTLKKKRTRKKGNGMSV